MNKFIAISLALVIGSTVTACAPSRGGLLDRSAELAAKAGMRKRVLPTDTHPILAFERITDRNGPIRVFIEGDGNAWFSRHQPSFDPTPLTPTALYLASVDEAPNVVYMARPCQYLFQNGKCKVPLWTTAQYSEAMVKTMNQALNAYNGNPIELVGYSGGAGMALLLAAQRNDIVSIRTVAGNLDNAAFTSHHRVSPLNGSLNPIDYVSRTYRIPQIHYSGENDTVVPSYLTYSYQASLPKSNCSRVIVVQNTDHTEGWVEHWHRMISRRMPCKS